MVCPGAAPAQIQFIEKAPEIKLLHVPFAMNARFALSLRFAAWLALAKGPDVRSH